jgi:hypothetical protein
VGDCDESAVDVRAAPSSPIASAGAKDVVLTIRRAQLLALEEVTLRPFRERALLHVREQFPDLYEERGDAAIREIVDLAVRKGRAYGLEAESELLRLLNVMVLVSPRLDVDPATPWAREILADTELGSETRIERLVARAVAFLDSQEDGDDAEGEQG